MKSASALVIAALVLGIAPATPAKFSAAVPAAPMRDTAETLLKKTIDDIGRQQFDAALGHVDDLIRLQPNFRLAHLIKGDLLLAKVKPLSNLGGAAGPAERLVDLRDEAIVRLRALKERPAADRVPRYLLQLRADQKYAIVVDTGRSRLYFYQNENGQPRLLTDYYVSSGKAGAQKMREGDMKTPVGVYHVTSSLPRAKLSDFYGAGAYPISYPNEWDRHRGRNGHGIWLHGTPSNTYSRPPRASDGCVVLSNADLEALVPDLQIGLTPVIISEGAEWVARVRVGGEVAVGGADLDHRQDQLRRLARCVDRLEERPVDLAPDRLDAHLGLDVAAGDHPAPRAGHGVEAGPGARLVPDLDRLTAGVPGDLERVARLEPLELRALVGEEPREITGQAPVHAPASERAREGVTGRDRHRPGRDGECRARPGRRRGDRHREQHGCRSAGPEIETRHRREPHKARGRERQREGRPYPHWFMIAGGSARQTQ